MSCPHSIHVGAALSLICVLTSPAQVAELLQAQLRLGIVGGMIVAVPPPEQSSLLGVEMQAVIDQAIDRAQVEGVRGKETTPFLLQQMDKLTSGESVIVNKALLENNAQVAAQIAVAVATSVL